MARNAGRPYLMLSGFCAAGNDTFCPGEIRRPRGEPWRCNCDCHKAARS